MEVYTAPLWMYISAALSLLGRKDWVYPLITITSVILSSTILLFLNRATYKIYQKSETAVSDLLLIALTLAIWLHTTSGLKSGGFGLGLPCRSNVILVVSITAHQNPMTR